MIYILSSVVRSILYNFTVSVYSIIDRAVLYNSYIILIIIFSPREYEVVLTRLTPNGHTAQMNAHSASINPLKLPHLPHHRLGARHGLGGLLTSTHQPPSLADATPSSPCADAAHTERSHRSDERRQPLSLSENCALTLICQTVGRRTKAWATS